MVGTAGTKEIATRYPVTSGLIARTTKQVGRVINLVAQSSRVLKRKKEGIDGK